MRIAYLDCFSGISGDMFLGALIDAGVPSKIFEGAVSALNIGARLEISRVIRSGISATKVDVYSQGGKDQPREMVSQMRSEDHQHGRDHEHAAHTSMRPEGTVSLPHSDEHIHEVSHQHHRELKDICEIIQKARTINESSKASAIAMFQALGNAEAKIHNMDIQSVHFHEVGAADAIVDIVCAAIGAHALGVDQIICSSLNVGGGTVKCAHGVFPVPAPATLELLQDAPVYSSGIEAELVTPTGATIVKTLATRFSDFPRMKVEKTGYGAGTRDFSGHPNVLRIVIGEAQEEFSDEVSGGAITVLETNLDDLNPQVLGYVMDRLLEEGALDAFSIPVQMKKNRPGMLLTVLCRPENTAKLSNIIFAETSTLGIRRREEKRQALTRKWQPVSTQWGEVRIKIASMSGTITNCAPEYEDCRRIAAEHHVPLKDVMQQALHRYLHAGNEKH